MSNDTSNATDHVQSRPVRNKKNYQQGWKDFPWMNNFLFISFRDFKINSYIKFVVKYQ